MLIFNITWLQQYATPAELQGKLILKAPSAIKWNSSWIFPPAKILTFWYSIYSTICMLSPMVLYSGYYLEIWHLRFTNILASTFLYLNLPFTGETLSTSRDNCDSRALWISALNTVWYPELHAIPSIQQHQPSHALVN